MVVGPAVDVAGQQPSALLDQSSNAAWHAGRGLNRSSHVVVEYRGGLVLPIGSWVQRSWGRPERCARLPWRGG